MVGQLAGGLNHNDAYDYDGYSGVAMMMPMMMMKLAMAWLTASGRSVPQ